MGISGALGPVEVFLAFSRPLMEIEAFKELVSPVKVLIKTSPQTIS